jgi:hypothetical protein
MGSHVVGERSAAIRGSLRGLVGAMAMTGTRTVTASVGPDEKSPPQAIVDRHGPPPMERLPEQHRAAITELLHWTYGAAGGVLFGFLPAPVRRSKWVGPAYGLAFWLAFELGVAPLMGVERARQRRLLWPALIAIDHVLYGLVVAGSLGPEPGTSPHPKPGVRPLVSSVAKAAKVASTSWISGLVRTGRS